MTSPSLVIDSGCSTTAIASANLLANLRPATSKHTVELANGKLCKVEKYGDLTVRVKNGNGDTTIAIKDCLYVPDLAMNLLGVGHMTKQGFRFKFSNDNNCVITPDSKRISYEGKDRVCAAYSFQLWHDRLGRSPTARVQSLLSPRRKIFGTSTSASTSPATRHSRLVTPDGSYSARSSGCSKYRQAWSCLSLASQRHFLTRVRPSVNVLG